MREELKPDKLITDAIDLAGAGLFGADWIGRLSKKEVKILDDHGPRRAPGAGGEVIRECPLSVAATLDRAMGRFARMNAQRATALDWLIDQKLVTQDHRLDLLTCDLAKIEMALAARRTTRRARKTSGTGKRRGRRPTESSRVFEAMRGDLLRSEMTYDSLKDATEKFLTHRYDASRGTCRKAREDVLDEQLARDQSNL